MTERWHPEGLPSDHLISIIEHAENMIDEWTRRRDKALAELTLRHEIDCKRKAGDDRTTNQKP